jgi:hypothetical protein
LLDGVHRAQERLQSGIGGRYLRTNWVSVERTRVADTVKVPGCVPPSTVKATVYGRLRSGKPRGLRRRTAVADISTIGHASPSTLARTPTTI